MAGLGDAGLVGDPETDDPQPRVAFVQGGDPREDVVSDQQAVVVQVDHHVHVPQVLQCDVPPAGHPEVVRQLHALHPRRQFRQRTPWPTSTTFVALIVCISTEASSSASSFGRVPMVRIATPSLTPTEPSSSEEPRE